MALITFTLTKDLTTKKCKKKAITEMTLLLTIQPLYVVTKPERGNEGD